MSSSLPDGFGVCFGIEGDAAAVAEVGALGVRKPWRRRGVGLALLHHVIRVFHARGERSVGLGVDSENPAGATRLYERAGMHGESESVTFEKSLT